MAARSAGPTPLHVTRRTLLKQSLFAIGTASERETIAAGFGASHDSVSPAKDALAKPLKVTEASVGHALAKYVDPLLFNDRLQQIYFFGRHLPQFLCRYLPFRAILLSGQTVQRVLEAEMDEALQAGKSERDENRLGYRSGYYGLMLVTRVEKIELRVPQDRQGRFRTEVFERYQRNEKALVAAMLEMYVQGVSTRKVKSITEEL